MFKKVSIATILAIMFVGCVVEEDLVTGKFVDREVDGIKYTCGGREGETSNGGLFKCPRGSSVEFWIDGVNIGGIETIEKPRIFTPADFDFIVLRGKKKELSKNEKKNLVPLVSAILLSLDDDGNPENGIKVEPRVENTFGEFFKEEVKPTAPTNVIELFKCCIEDPLETNLEKVKYNVNKVTEKTIEAVREKLPEDTIALKPFTLDEVEEHIIETKQAIKEGDIKPPINETDITGAEGGA